MKKRLLLLLISFILTACSGLGENKDTQKNVEIFQINPAGEGQTYTLHFVPGKAHNHPTFAIWLETAEGDFIQTLYVTQSLATGWFGHGQLDAGRWKDEPGISIRRATLPYWLHKSGILKNGEGDMPVPENPAADGFTGATPRGEFYLTLKSDIKPELPYRFMLEINQTWDWNPYWHNNKYPDDFDYKSSSQPALVYSVMIDSHDPSELYYLNPIGHSHYGGKNGKLYTDLSTLTTALDIIREVSVRMGDGS
ncbi:MAG: hypothetical protein ACP5D8_10185 [Fidelibacterota bacterium]